MTTIFSSSVDDDVPPGIREIAARMERRRLADNDAPPFDLKTILAMVTLGSMLFTAGYNWREIMNLRTEYDKHVIETNVQHEKFMPRELADGQYRELHRRLDYLQTLLEQARDRKR
jgi:hypothetical protein